jgi:isoleucyl-tRNA synthetase
LQEVKKSIESGSAEIDSLVNGDDPKGEITLSGVLISRDDLIESYKAEVGWVGDFRKTTFGEIIVAIDTRLTKELKQEGMAREVIRQVQEFRKKSNLEMEDRIALVLTTSAPELSEAIAAFKDYIASETLTVEWPASVPAEAFTTEVKAEGMGLGIGIRKVQ